MNDYPNISRDEVLSGLDVNIIGIVKAIGRGIVPRRQIIPDMGLSGRRSWRKYHLDPAREQGYVVMMKPDVPNSPSQMYRLTQKGLDLLNMLEEMEEVKKDPRWDPERPSN